METIETLITQEMHRATIYTILSDAFRLPDVDVIKSLDALEKALFCLKSTAWESGKRLHQWSLSPSDLCPLKVEYTRLFLGPFKAPAAPYGSVYLENSAQLMGESTVDARHHYQSLGLDLPEENKEPPDHISIELEFMHVLVIRAITAINDFNKPLLTETIRHQHLFMENHLGAWANVFTDAIIQHTESDYYRHLAQLTQEFVQENRQMLLDLVVELEEQEDGCLQNKMEN